MESYVLFALFANITVQKIVMLKMMEQVRTAPKELYSGYSQKWRNSMKWCNLMNMWCSDMDEEDFANVCCDGKCRSCDEFEEVSDER